MLLAIRDAGYGLEHGLAAALALAAAWGLFVLMAQPEGAALRIACLALAAGVVLALAAGVALALRRLPALGELAVRLEAAEPAFEGHLLACAEALESRPVGAAVPPAVLACAVGRAAEVFKRVPLGAGAPQRAWVRAHGRLGGASACVLILAALAGADLLAALLRGFDPDTLQTRADPPHFLEVRPGEAEAVAGEVLAVEARVGGEAPDEVVLEIAPDPLRLKAGPPARALWPVEPGAVGKEAAPDVAQLWRGTLAAPAANAAYRLVLLPRDLERSARRPEPVATPWYPLRVRPPSSVARLDILVEPPAYTGLKPRVWRDPEKLQALQGSRLTVLLRAGPSKDLGAGRLERPGAPAVDLAREALQGGNEALYRVELEAQKSGVLRVTLEGRRAAQPGPQALCLLTVVPDRPPQAEASVPAGAEPGPGGLPVELLLSDDLGLAQARLRIQALPGGDPSEALLAPASLAFEIPLPPSARKFDGPWLLPPDGLDEAFARGFRYRVEASDTAQPLAQRAESAWKTWVPERREQAARNEAGLFEKEREPATRRLTRPGAFSNIPDVSPEQLAQAGDLGGGQPPPDGLRRPDAQRLGKQPPPPVSSGQGSGTSNASGGGSSYETLNGPPRPQPKEGAGTAGSTEGSGPHGSNPGEAQQPKPGEGHEKSKPEPGGDSPAGGAPQGDEGQGEKGSSGSGKQGEGQGAQPKPGGRGEREDPRTGGAGDGGGSQPGQGAPTGESNQGEDGDGPREGSGPKRSRDGGPKTGHELGSGGGEMAPPDLETLSRMKGIGLDEARTYAERHGMLSAKTDFGRARTSKETTVVESNAPEGRPFSFNAPPVPGAPGGGEADPQATLRARVKGVDPAYRALVEGYFRRVLQAARNEK
ncbi:MAG: hypothetical protein M5U26_24310 [Planctomycetota bacterium]|nr:hypothetical protein [Planctomycetota bacterium]